MVTDRKLIFNAVVKYSLQMQQRSFKAFWFLLLFQKWVKLTLFMQPGAKINSVYYTVIMYSNKDYCQTFAVY